MNYVLIFIYPFLQAATPAVVSILLRGQKTTAIPILPTLLLLQCCLLFSSLHHNHVEKKCFSKGIREVVKMLIYLEKYFISGCVQNVLHIQQKIKNLNIE